MAGRRPRLGSCRKKTAASHANPRPTTAPVSAPPQLSTKRRAGRMSTKRRADPTSDPAATPSRTAPASAPIRLASVESPGTTCGASHEPRKAPMATPTIERIWAARPRKKPCAAINTTHATSRTSAIVTDSLYSDDEVDQAARHDDRLADLLAVQMALHARKLLGTRDELVLGQVDRDLDATAHATVDLDDQLERLLLEQRGVRLRPRRRPQTLMAEALPQLLGD